LNLMCFNYTLEDVLDSDVLTLACQMVHNGKDGTEIVGRVAPFNNKGVVISVRVGARETEGTVGDKHTFCSKKAVIKVEPTDDGPDVERSLNQVKLVVSPWDLSSCRKVEREWLIDNGSVT
jgi:hypothetical protein